jgi:FPC/CPF motif-containing protein YcgG
MPPVNAPAAGASLTDFRDRFEAYVASGTFPCVGARSAIARRRARFALYKGLGHPCSAARLCRELEVFSAEFPRPGRSPVTFVAMFEDSVATEREFESRMWQHLQQIHLRDRQSFAWDPTVSDDPGNPDFSFSVAGRAFFVVGLCPVASRFARRAPMPCMVFNFHDQFETLRASGSYESYQRIIRERDRALQGEINPALAGFGEQSEARQYAGRAPEPGWRCPLHTGARHDA